MQSLIRRGANSATIEIQLRNSSSRAYKRHIYGDHITIIREINASGSHYKIKAASGEIISTRLKEVEAIKHALGIQVDNPISVLNQDDARSFLGKGPEKMYALFRKATNLDQAEDKYKETLKTCDEAIEHLKMKEQASKELEKEYHSLRASYDQMRSYEEFEQQIQQLQNEYYWREVVEVETEAHDAETQYNTVCKKITELTQKGQDIEQIHRTGLSALEVLKRERDEKSLQKNALQQDVSTYESQAREAQSSLRTVQQTVQKYQDRFDREQKKVLDLEREIGNIQSGAQRNERARLTSRAAAARSAAEAARARERTAQHDAAQARGHAAHTRARADDAAAALRTHRHALNRLTQQLRDLESCSSDSLAVYGNSMVTLRKEVEEAVKRGEFSAPPKGPIGDYIKVTEKQWVGTLEHILGGSITTFCVNNASDSRKLIDIMNKVYGPARKPAVSCSAFLRRRHDVRAREVRGAGGGAAGGAPLRSALGWLQVDDPEVYNHLVDALRLETVLLVPDHQTAVELCSEEHRVPRHLSKAVSRDCAEYYPAPRYRSYGVRARPPRYLQHSSRDRTRQLKSEIQEAQVKLRELEGGARACEQEAERARQYERALADTLHALALDKIDKEEKEKIAIAELEQYQEPRQTVLEDELKLSKEKAQSVQEQLNAQLAEEQRWRGQHQQLDNKVRELRNRLSDLTSACRDLTEEIDREQIKLENIASQITECEVRVQKYRKELSRTKAALEEKKEVVRTKIEETSKLCPRVRNPRQKALITEELKNTKDKMNAMRCNGMTKVQVAEKLIVVKKKYHEISAELQQLGAVIESIKETAKQHLQFSHFAQTYIIRQLYYIFQSILTLRGYCGNIEVDAAAGRLRLQCSAGAAPHSAGLSGGEQSYSTVAFLLALWDCAEMPFYFMDEFDVFMDDVNRKIIMQLLINHALKNSGRQFVFLTPKDISCVSAGPQIDIHLLPNPRS